MQHVERGAGLDIHKDLVVVSVRVGDQTPIVRSFRTVTADLLTLRDWLEEHGVTHVAMESTGVYWRPVWHILDGGGFKLILANARDVRNLPGRKTDVKDAEWISELLIKGMLPSSFVPPQPIQDLRDLTRTRKQLSREVCQHVQRIQKVLEEANIKLDSFLSDVMGKSGRRVLEAIVAGVEDAEELLDLISKRARASRRDLRDALQGHVRDHHRFLLDLHLKQIDAITVAISDIERRINDLVTPFRDTIHRLTGIPGVGRLVAETIVAECGTDMSSFRTVGHFISWAGLVPRNDRSAGKSRSVAILKGNSWLKPALVQAAWAAARTKDTYLRAQFLRIKARRGPKKAIIAVAASILTSVYFIIRDKIEYQDLGGDYFDRLDRERLIAKHIQRLENLGVKVSITREPPAGAA